MYMYGVCIVVGCIQGVYYCDYFGYVLGLLGWRLS